MVISTIRRYILRHKTGRGTEAREWTLTGDGDRDGAVGTTTNEVGLRRAMEKNGNGNMCPQNCAYSFRDPDCHLRYGSLGPRKSTNQTASRRFIRFCMAHGCIQQTDRQTDRHRPRYINSNRPHSMTCIATRPRNVKKF